MVVDSFGEILGNTDVESEVVVGEDVNPAALLVHGYDSTIWSGPPLNTSSRIYFGIGKVGVSDSETSSE